MAKGKKPKKRKRPVKDKGIKVVLLDDIFKLGQRGEVKIIKPGYYKYLTGTKKVIAVTKNNIHRIEDLKLIALKRTEKGKALAELLKNKIDEIVFRTTIKIGEHGEIYSSVTKNEIKDFLKEKGIKIEKNHIDLEHPIRELCEKTIEIHLGYGIVGNLKIIVEAE